MPQLQTLMGRALECASLGQSDVVALEALRMRLVEDALLLFRTESAALAGRTRPPTFYKEDVGSGHRPDVLQLIADAAAGTTDARPSREGALGAFRPLYGTCMPRLVTMNARFDSVPSTLGSFVRQLDRCSR